MSLHTKDICKENRTILKISSGFHKGYFQWEHTFENRQWFEENLLTKDNDLFFTQSRVQHVLEGEVWICYAAPVLPSQCHFPICLAQQCHGLGCCLCAVSSQILLHRETVSLQTILVQCHAPHLPQRNCGYNLNLFIFFPVARKMNNSFFRIWNSFNNRFTII